MHCPKLKIQPAKNPRGPPGLKKFWCAFHKGDSSKCGGGKTDRGCARSHHTHERTQQVSSTDSNKEEGVLLLIMNVRAKRTLVSVFWDLGSTSNFIRESCARRCGFKGREETLSVTTFGGVDRDYYTVISYTCRLIDLDGTVFEFTCESWW